MTPWRRAGSPLGDVAKMALLGRLVRLRRELFLTQDNEVAAVAENHATLLEINTVQQDLAIGFHSCKGSQLGSDGEPAVISPGWTAQLAGSLFHFVFNIRIPHEA